MSMNITTQQSHYNAYTIIIDIDVFVCGRANGLGPAGSGLKWDNCVASRAGPDLDILFAGRAGPGPHNSICRPVLHNCCGPGPGLGLKSSYLRAEPGPKFQARAGP